MEIGTHYTIAVGSESEIKIGAVKDAFKSDHFSFEVRGCAAASGVSDQPVGKEETLLGARNRNKATQEAIPGN